MSMKKVEAVISGSKLGSVRAALAPIGITQIAQTPLARQSKLKIGVIVPEEITSVVVRAIESAG
jgi:hypothetical protein